MKVDEMLPYLKEHKEELIESIHGEWYKPKPVKRVEILKPDGGKRQLGVPMVIDRMVQQVVMGIATHLWGKPSRQTTTDSGQAERPSGDGQSKDGLRQ